MKYLLLYSFCVAFYYFFMRFVETDFNYLFVLAILSFFCAWFFRKKSLVIGNFFASSLPIAFALIDGLSSGVFDAKKMLLGVFLTGMLFFQLWSAVIWLFGFSSKIFNK